MIYIISLFPNISVNDDMLVGEYLNVNSNEDKEMVIRNKKFWFYFRGKFDVSPFVCMPLSVLPEVMSQIEEGDKQSAIYRLLQCIPELSNVSERKSSEQSGNKRQKMTLRPRFKTVAYRF